ncbi:hypothetical protein [Marinifilum flexuosum]|uniref:hypothetical protein n=1 Tax=Marinifilum flexuosum TaxID=1117708 RepID=UPI00249551FF|nr:hypothetical protein [Marinifilum flexuosum]
MKEAKGKSRAQQRGKVTERHASGASSLYMHLQALGQHRQGVRADWNAPQQQ